MDIASQVFPLWLVGQFGKGVGKGEVPHVTVGMGGYSSIQWSHFQASVLRSYQSPVAFSCSTHGETGITMGTCMPPCADAGQRIISVNPFSPSTMEFQGVRLRFSGLHEPASTKELLASLLYLLSQRLIFSALCIFQVVILCQVYNRKILFHSVDYLIIQLPASPSIVTDKFAEFTNFSQHLWRNPNTLFQALLAFKVPIEK